ncbi:MAG: ATP-grasp domain-containing protein [Proteobacteria bacterium]|nr:ATP-grasp domain-containing protein [Pseudomonadota bacterium]NOG59087.1 ATP-grasp domain-containing protein [Pseudomonadota bacterium]
MKTIVITGIGGDIAQGVATIIREQRPEIRLIGVDMNLQHGGYLFVDDFIQVPSSNSSKYIQKIKDILLSESVDTIIPMSEPELEVMYPYISKLGETHCICAGERVISVGIDKLLTINVLKEIGIPVPWTLSVSDGLPSDFPCILKNRYGSGSRNIYVVEDVIEAEYLSLKYPDTIFQEMLEPADQEITCAVYRRRDGNVASLLMLRRLIGGYTGWAKVIEDEATFLMCESIAKGLDLYGSMNIQLRITEQGPRVFEINPRFSSTVLMRHILGFSDVLWSLDESEGKLVSFPKIITNQIIVRTQSAKIC